MSRLNKNLAMRQGDCNADDSPSESQRTLMPSDTSNRETAPPSGVQEVTEAMLDAAMAEYFGTESLRDLVSEKMIEAEREDMKKAIQAAIRAAEQVNAEPLHHLNTTEQRAIKRALVKSSAPHAEPTHVRVPVDRSKQTLTDGSAVPADRSHTKDRGDGQQKGYVVLSADERAKGFVRPVRQRYVHKKCGVETHMGLALAETYARDPEFYSGTFCVGCKGHFPLDEFVWSDTNERVGS